MIDLKDIPMFSNETEAIAFLNKLIIAAEKVLIAYDTNGVYFLQNTSFVANLQGQIIAYKEAIQILTNLNRKVEEDIELEREHEQSRYTQDCQHDDFW